MKYLILGVGEVGFALVKKLLAKNPDNNIHIHTRNRSSCKRKISEIKADNFCYGNVSSSWGDLFLSSQHLRSSENSDLSIEDIKYLNDESERWFEGSLLYKIIQEFKPDYVIDTVTIALNFNKRSFLKTKHKNDSKEDLDIDFVCNNPIRLISSFVQVLNHALEDFSIKHYVKVSSSGLAGMGFNCPYTHGSNVSFKLSTPMESKIAFLGVFQQFLWNLYDSKASKISLIVPKALIGWEAPFSKEYIYNDHFNGNLSKTLPTSGDDPQKFSLACIPCGDSTFYSLQEYILATSVGQFECVLKEEVVEAILDSLWGLDRFNILNIMNKFSLSSSYKAGYKRDEVLQTTRSIESQADVKSIVTGNLGPFVAKIILEAYLILQSIDCLENFSQVDASILSQRIMRYLDEHPEIYTQLLNSDLSIITKFDSSCKNELKNKIDLSNHNINLWVVWLEKNIEKNTFPRHFSRNWLIENVGTVAAAYFNDIGFSRLRI